MQEIWKQWKPIEGLSERYFIAEFHETLDEFWILLLDINDRSSRVRVIFEGYVYSYRSVDEGCRVKTIGMLDELYGGQFYSKWTFFTVENSEYLQWLSKESGTWSDAVSMKHFAFITDDVIFDVAITYAPKVELVTGIKRHKILV